MKHTELSDNHSETEYEVKLIWYIEGDDRPHTRYSKEFQDSGVRRILHEFMQDTTRLHKQARVTKTLKEVVHYDCEAK